MALAGFLILSLPGFPPFSSVEAQDLPRILEVNEEPTTGATFTLSVRVSPPAPVVVEFGPENGGTFRLSNPSDSAHTFTLARLNAGEPHQYRVVAGTDTVDGRFQAPPLPPDLQTLVDSMAGRPTPELLLLEAGKRPGWRGLVAMDQDGDVVWYCETGGLIHGAIRRTTGSWVVIDPAVGLRELSPACETLATLPRLPRRPMHHDLVEAPDGSILYLSKEGRAVEGGRIRGDFIRRWIPETGESEEVWSPFEHMDPETDMGPRSRSVNWLHANSLSLGPRGNLVVGFAMVDQVVSIPPDFSGIEWRMGGPNATHPVEESQAFRGQHTASEVAPNRILLFDNDIVGDRGWSRAVEYELVDGLAREVWSFRAPSGNWSRVQSSAYRLENGNTLVTFGASARQSASSGPIELFEVTPAKEIVWYLRVGEDFQTVYRARAVSTIGGEVPVGNAPTPNSSSPAAPAGGP